MSHYEHPQHNIVLQVGRTRIRWLFRHSHDWFISRNFILPWAMADRECRFCDQLQADFTVSVYGTDRNDQEYLDSLAGTRFSLHGEPNWPPVYFTGQLVFAPGENPLPTYRWAPSMIFWAPPHTVKSKTLKCSAIESGGYTWRNDLVDQVFRQVGGLDGFGSYFAKPIPGAHGWDNQKYLGLQPYAFSLGIESNQLSDYITEKANDVLINEGVLIYQGAPNWMDYMTTDAVIPLLDVPKINWNNWQGEYAQKRPAVLLQKELMRSRFNVFRYFIALVENPDLLNQSRPITRFTKL